MEESVFAGKRGLTVAGWAKSSKVPADFSKSLWESIDDPDELPYLLDAVMKGFNKIRGAAREEIRNALMRVQIHCSIHSDSDPIKLSKQLYVTQALERLLFGSNKLLSDEFDEGAEK